MMSHPIPTFFFLPKLVFGYLLPILDQERRKKVFRSIFWNAGEVHCWPKITSPSSKKEWHYGRSWFSFPHHFQKKNLQLRNSIKRELFKWLRMGVFLLHVPLCYVIMIIIGLTEPTAENLSKLQDKHPSQDIPIFLPPFEDFTQKKVDSKLILKKLWSFPKGFCCRPNRDPSFSHSSCNSSIQSILCFGYSNWLY